MTTLSSALGGVYVLVIIYRVLHGLEWDDLRDCLSPYAKL